MKIQIGFCFLFVIFSVACTPIQRTRGNFIEDYKLASVIVGQDTRADIIKKLGSPTTIAPFDDNTWYYIGRDTIKKGIFDEELARQKIAVIAFADTGVVTIARELDANAQKIPIDEDETLTGGNDITVLQQLLGNIGRYNVPQQNQPVGRGI